MIYLIIESINFITHELSFLLLFTRLQSQYVASNFKELYPQLVKKVQLHATSLPRFLKQKK
jgi:hypothetical protein